MADAYAAMKHIAPDFKFMPTVYPGFLGVYAGASGYTLGVGAGLPFDVDTSASFSLAPADAGIGAHSSRGSLSFWLASTYSTWDRNGLAFDPVWRGKLFVRAVLQLPAGQNVTSLILTCLVSPVAHLRSGLQLYPHAYLNRCCTLTSRCRRSRLVGIVLSLIHI